MYKIIANVDALKHFQEKTRHTLSLWENTHAVAGIKEIVEQTDIYYGADRDIFADMGGYLIIFYGDSTEIAEHLMCQVINDNGTVVQVVIDSPGSRMRGIIFERNQLVSIAVPAHGLVFHIHNRIELRC